VVLYLPDWIRGGRDLPDAVVCRGVEEPPVPVVDEEDESIGLSVRWVWVWVW